MSRTAVWSRRIALLTLQLFILTILLHQFAGLATPVAMRLFGIAVIGAVIALALALVALWRIWLDGAHGSRRALLAIFAAALVLAGPAWSLPKLVMEPGVTEVTTDASAPPAFRELGKVRAEIARQMRAAAGPAANGSASEPMTMTALTVERSAEETFSLVRESVDELGWRLVSATPPSNGQPGYIEAVDRSLLFGITGDVAVRIKGGQRRARVDVRSASRYVEHDLGGNAERVSSLFQEVETAVARLEKNEEIARLAVCAPNAPSASAKRARPRPVARSARNRLTTRFRGSGARRRPGAAGHSATATGASISARRSYGASGSR